MRTAGGNVRPRCRKRRGRRELIERARQLVEIYTQALSAHAREIEELRASGVPASRVLNLYPYDWVDWAARGQRLEAEITEYPVQQVRGKDAQVLRYLIRRLLTSSARAFATEQAIQSCAHLSKASVAILDIGQYLQLLTMTLHLLAYSSEAEAVLEGARALRFAGSVLDIAEALRAEPTFAES